MHSLWNTRWLSFLPWIDVGVPGALSRAAQVLSVSAGSRLRQARQAARLAGSWLVALVATLRRVGQARREARSYEWAAWLLAGMHICPFAPEQTRWRNAWLLWLLEAEMQRLARLIAAPEMQARRPDWLPAEVRYWALAATLIRLGQVYIMLENWQGEEQAQRILKRTARGWLANQFAPEGGLCPPQNR